ncbi:D-allose transport system permease protein AlsC [Escherichia coli]|uniref:D-allose transport system permease protein AlsC n=1 Tax=Escherichia coli TaxID=562 RepID=A0A2X3JSQ5_ECOLX|nr:D-allose transport system permease protein AlsC [Escherichia coli]
MVTAKLMLAGVDPFLAAMIGGVLVGGALGAINGCLVNWTGLHPFIITLGTNAIFRGITLVISDANSVYGFSFDFVNFFAASVIGIPVPVIFSLIVALILWFLTTRMRLGRNIYALGGNKNSAFYSGIDVKFHILVVFIISGVCAGLAGVVSTARLGAAEPLAGMGFENLCHCQRHHWRHQFLRRQGAHFLCGDWRVDHRHHQQRSEYFAGTNLLPTGGDGRINYRGCRP